MVAGDDGASATRRKEEGGGGEEEKEEGLYLGLGANDRLMMYGWSSRFAGEVKEKGRMADEAVVITLANRGGRRRKEERLKFNGRGL